MTARTPTPPPEETAMTADPINTAGTLPVARGHQPPGYGPHNPRPIPTREDRMRHATDATERQAPARYLVDAFNRMHPIGTPVRYWTGVREGDGKVSRTRTVAQLLSGHTAVVWLENVSGCIALTHVQPITEEELADWLAAQPPKIPDQPDGIEDGREQIDRALAMYDTEPHEEPDREDAPHEDPARMRQQLAEAHADCARYATERDEARAERDERLTLAESSRLAKRYDQAEEERDYLRRLLDQTTAALNVALHHANDNTSYSPTTDHYKQRAVELDGCRIALQEATEAVAAPSLGSPADRAQDDLETDVPDWVLELVRGLAKYEAEHPKLYRHRGINQVEPALCPCPLLEGVPAAVRRLAEKVEG